MSKGTKGPTFRGGITEMMRYANRIQQKLAEMKEAVKEQHFEAASGGGRVSATVSGERKVVKVSIDREKANLEDLAEIEDLVVAAINMALDKADEHIKEESRKITGGMDLPGLF